ncbi:MAG: oxygen-dependent coproporphyrinogen-III oxidase [Myxococcales bacterium]
MTTLRGEAQEFFRGLRDRICARLEELDGGKFKRTKWERPGGGGGEMSELRGEVFEKAGCNFSAVWGDKYPASVDQPSPSPSPSASPSPPTSPSTWTPTREEDARLGIRPPTPAELAGKPFFATGVSLVLHPRNPFVPVVHLNVRYLEAGDVSWFGGGTDLTPCREFVEDTRHFHRVLQKVCNAHGPGLYDRFSRWAKEYFFIGHRGSERGVGGIFFDYLRGEERWSFVRDVGDAFLPAYAPLVERRRATPYSDEDRAQQLRWRGRYVEFNLIYDRGTLFGLRTGGNVEAIFMSLPPLVAW